MGYAYGMGLPLKPLRFWLTSFSCTLHREVGYTVRDRRRESETHEVLEPFVYMPFP